MTTNNPYNAGQDGSDGSPYANTQGNAGGSNPYGQQYGESAYGSEYSNTQGGTASNGSQYGVPNYGGQQPYGQPQYGHQDYSQAPADQGYGQQGYGQASYGQVPYGQAPYGQQGYGQPMYAGGYAVGTKSKLVAGLLGIFLGSLGVHNFYLGRMGRAWAQLLISLLSLGMLAWAVGIWGLIEGILILASQPGTQWHRDGQNLELVD
ncbi:TM2 domain-containing protein [Timonella senegalensis]|uniref:TM2 domain-containing protein n=1 Tax=Timonella senegalensis TaxID=1465825 RepID=UPI0002D521A1|nr:TM2 domain-containing protein [Timonella senegalensis]